MQGNIAKSPIIIMPYLRSVQYRDQYFLNIILRDKIKVKKEETYIKFLATLNGVAVIVEFDGKGTFNKMEKGVF